MKEEFKAMKNHNIRLIKEIIYCQKKCYFKHKKMDNMGPKNKNIKPNK